MATVTLTPSSVVAPAWTNPNNATTVDGNYAHQNVNTGDNSGTLDLLFTAVAPGLDSQARIDGVTFALTRSNGNILGAVKDDTIQLHVGGELVGSNQYAIGNWPDVLTEKSYGGAGNVWGLSAPARQLTDPTMRVRIIAASTGEGQAQPRIDGATLTIAYAAASVLAVPGLGAGLTGIGM